MRSIIRSRNSGDDKNNLQRNDFDDSLPKRHTSTILLSEVLKAQSSSDRKSAKLVTVKQKNKATIEDCLSSHFPQHKQQSISSSKTKRKKTATIRAQSQRTRNDVHCDASEPHKQNRK